jgi:hypothetical protein
MITAVVRARFGQKLVLVGFVVGKVTLVGQVSLRVLTFSFVTVTLSMIQRHIFHHQSNANCMLLLGIPLLKLQCWQHLIRT